MATENVTPAADLADLVAQLVEASDKQSREAVAARVVSILKKATAPAPTPMPAVPFHKFGGWAHKGVTEFASPAEVARFVHVTAERIEPLLEVVRDHMRDNEPAYDVGVLVEAAMEAAWQVAEASNGLIRELDPVTPKPALAEVAPSPDLLQDINARLLDLLPLVRAIGNEADAVPQRDDGDNTSGPAHRVASLSVRIHKDVREMLELIEQHV